LEILRPVNDPSSWAEAIAERSFMKEVGGGCKIPIGAFARAEGETVKLLGSVISPDGARRIDIVEQGDMKHPEDTGKTAANRILRMGAEKIIRAWSKP
jgi:hydroxymethylbilane synthase